MALRGGNTHGRGGGGMENRKQRGDLGGPLARPVLRDGPALIGASILATICPGLSAAFGVGGGLP